MRVFVTGGTGVIGRRAIPLLIERGHHVTAIGRSSEKRAALARRGATAVAVDLFDGTGLRRVLKGQDAVLNLATHIPGSTTSMFFRWAWRENDRIRRVASAVLVDAATASGVSRFIQESFAPVYPDRGAEWVDESVPLQPVAYNMSILDAERSAIRFTASGGAGVILRFGGFYGPDGFAPHDMLGMVRRGWSPLPGAPEAYLSSISHDDAAAAAVAALELPAGVYNVVDDEPLTRRDYVGTLARIAGVPMPRFMPGWATGMMGSLGRLLARSVRMSNKKLAAAAPTWRPRYRSAREGLVAAMEEGQARVA